MTIDDAAELHTTWAARFNAKDLDGMLALAEGRSPVPAATRSMPSSAVNALTPERTTVR